MNDGVISLITQWCLLCLLWMGLFDRALQRIRVSRAVALAGLMLSLVCAYANWQLYFLPVSINVSGTLLPIMAAAWVWSVLPAEGKHYCVLSVLFSVFLQFAARKLFFWDPVLLIMDEHILLPLVLVCTTFLLVREWQQQLVILLLSLPLADGLYVISNEAQWENGIVGGEYAQDLLWSVLSLWILVAFAWSVMTKGFSLLRVHLVEKWKAKTYVRR
ncbi:YphA family membrane protein [Brevibacillus migulae]|uniref:YphA family membrane protein n=1 Tax=Brevibacillus migulae TaxID=1644114 RepID=UPI00106ED7D5|nr:hypothetical protein [Brevibacillus migulae]